MRLFLHPISLLSPHKHRISIRSLKILVKNLRGKNPEVTDFTKGRVIWNQQQGSIKQQSTMRQKFRRYSWIVRKLYEAAEIPIKQEILSESDATAWVTLFATALGDALEEGIF